MGWLFWLLWSVATIIPLTKILPHFGIRPVWAFTAIFPIAVPVLLWIMAMHLAEMDRR